MLSIDETSVSEGYGGSGSLRKIVVVPVAFEEEPSYREGAWEAYRVFAELLEEIEDYSLVFRGSLEDLNIVYEAPVASPDDIVSLFERHREHVPWIRWAFIGGNHSVSSYIVEQLSRFYEGLGVLVFDGHLDLYDSYRGSRKSHACASYRMAEIVGFSNLAVVGVKTASSQEVRRAQELAFWDSDYRSILSKGHRHFKGKPLYLSVDMDVFSPAVAPAVANPEPGGWSYEDFLKAIRAVSYLDVIAFDIVEYLPSVDLTRSTGFLFTTLFREIVVALWGRQ